MSLSRSPSPRPDGGWSSPGLTTGTGGSGTSTPRKGYSDLQSGGGLYMKGIGATGPGGVSWAAAKAKSDQVPDEFGLWRERKAGPRTMEPEWRTVVESLKNTARKFATTETSTTVIALDINVCFLARFFSTSSLGGGKKIVLIVASNLGGGVMEWKGAREWAIERDSLRNKRRYVKRWGYDLEIVNMVTKKRYAHEWRESWEKVDTIRSALRKYPKAEWFWWLDLHTFIMEPSLSVENHILKNLGKKTYRNINTYNPLNITHPPSLFYLDPLSLSVEGDGKESSINMLVPQDCSGFNLGSFMVRRSAWTDRLLDIWWDPVLYEQKHMEWEHKEQDSLEHLYTHQPWIRPHVAFVPQRRMNSFPPGACGDGTNLGIHYQEKNRDFLVNMAGCEWGRDCWSEMYHYRQLSNRLNRNPWEKFKDGISERWKKTFGKKKEEKKKT
ncbi:golgi mannosyltransferase complex subunit [Coccidioides immitis RMSCC 2394]|uniref:Golgi mannosyltransferase complex subunit n=1 Tax=Coccidioides immitis RMSCC 2394 TaxID=404692 RepID=A0A0J6Y442_COCIT|nr:golgi mannosyltransferase complex subunit [Coccidioides immitis RMSCC 2394]